MENPRVEPAWHHSGALVGPLTPGRLQAPHGGCVSFVPAVGVRKVRNVRWGTCSNSVWGHVTLEKWAECDQAVLRSVSCVCMNSRYHAPAATAVWLRFLLFLLFALVTAFESDSRLCKAKSMDPPPVISKDIQRLPLHALAACPSEFDAARPLPVLVGRGSGFLEFRVMIHDDHWLGLAFSCGVRIQGLPGSFCQGIPGFR